jgi:hypothetical protein
MPSADTGGGDGALFAVPGPGDPDEPIALAHIEAYFQDAVDRARAKAEAAQRDLLAAQDRQAAWRETRVLPDHEANLVASRATGAAVDLASALINTPGFPNVALDRTAYERALAEEDAVRRWLRAHGHPHVLEARSDGGNTRPETPSKRRSTRR